MRNPFRRRPEVVEQRDISEVPWDVGGPSRISVNQAQALTLTPVYAANRHIADTVSSLPLQAHRKVDEERRPMGSLPQLFKMLDDTGMLGDWVYESLTSLALRGNAVGLVAARDGMGFPVEVFWLPMSEVQVDDSNPVRPIWWWRGRRLAGTGRNPTVDEFVHIPWFKLPGKTLGLSPIEAYALTISSGIQAQTYGNDWFAAGGVPPGRFKNSEKTINETDANVIRARLVSAIRSRKPLVYGSDWDYDPYVIPPEQAQFIETMKLTANQVAAIYGIDPTEVGGEAANSMTYANEEHREIRKIQDLRPWIVRLERKFSAWLPNLQQVRFNTDAVIRADTKTRHEVYKLQREIGMANVDEIRAHENQQPLPDGEGKDFAPLGHTTAPQPPPPGPAPSLNGNGQVPELVAKN